MQWRLLQLLVEPKLRQNAMGKYPATEEMRKVASNVLGLPLGWIHLLVNYTVVLYSELLEGARDALAEQPIVKIEAASLTGQHDG